MTRLHFLALLATAAAACGDDLAAPPPDAPSPRTIRGTASLVAADEAGHTTRFPIGLHDTLITAQFLVGDAWVVREGITSDDGTFSIDDAADGAYWLEVYDVPTGARQLLWTDATELAFEEHANGRGDAEVAGPSTTMTFDLDGLDPVGPSDGLQLAIGNLGLNANLFGALQLGGTTVHSTRLWTGNPLISAAAGDRMILAQTRTTDDASTGLETTSIVTAATFDSIEEADRANTPVAGTFTTPPVLDYDLRWSRSQFAAAAADIHPSRVGPVESEQFALRAEPGGVGSGTSPLAPIVLTISSPLTGSDDLDLPFAIHNPYPADWLFTDVSMGFPVVIPAPDDPSQQANFLALMEVNTDVLPDADHPLAPLVTPPRHPTIAGMDMFADHAGVGLTPTIAWSPPAHGAPTAYVIRVLRWLIQSGGSSPITIATLVVPGDVTEVRLPDRVLAPGELYFLDIAAIAQAGQDVRVHSLYTLAVPSGFAELFGNTFAP